MATLDHLKRVLREASLPHRPLSNAEYVVSFESLIKDTEGCPYEEFIIPQLSRLLRKQFETGKQVSVLDIGPGPETIFASLPEYLRRSIKSYDVFEPNGLSTEKLKETLQCTSLDQLFPYLQRKSTVRQVVFCHESGTDRNTSNGEEKYDLILFCHSMYGMNPKGKYLRRALDLLTEDGVIVVFHRDGLYFDGLVCTHEAVFPTGITHVPDQDEALDLFASFVAGGISEDDIVRQTWRGVCRTLRRRDDAFPGQLVFDSLEDMILFTRHATALPELTSQMPVVAQVRKIKNREARLQRPAAIVRPTDIQQVQQCVQWALKHRVSLTIIGGSHGGHCLRDNVVAVDMSAFNQVYIITEEGAGGGRNCSHGNCPLVVAGAGSTTEDVIRETMAAGLTVPLGSRPSVGAGLWLQGGIGHLARPHGLACDAIVGAVIVSVEFSEILCVGRVPAHHVPCGAIRPENEFDLLWAIQGAGTNFGFVISVVFKASPAPIYLTRTWIMPLDDKFHAQLRFHEFNLIAKKLDGSRSADAYLYWEDTQMRLAVTVFDTSTSSVKAGFPAAIPAEDFWGPGTVSEAMNGIGVFESELYVSGLRGGHGGGKTSSFKRCIFLKDIANSGITNYLVTAIESRPSLRCYFHLLQGGGAVGNVAADATAFGCRDWDFACVITGVWLQEQGDDSEVARTVKRWAHKVARDLLPLSHGAYGADLGQDSRDVTLATKAFGPNLQRLRQLKHVLDPSNVLAYACPLPNMTVPKLIVLVTGKSCAGKDHCVNVWSQLLNRVGISASVVSISDASKRDYAAEAVANLGRLLKDRAYEEVHRPMLSAFYHKQIQQRPCLPEEHFHEVVHRTIGVEVLFITGMRDDAPVASFAHLVADSRLLEVQVRANEQTHRQRLESPS